MLLLMCGSRRLSLMDVGDVGVQDFAKKKKGQKITRD
jgi:hypothetical protein